MSIITIRRRQSPIREWEEMGIAVEKMTAAFRAVFRPVVEQISAWLNRRHSP